MTTIIRENKKSIRVEHDGKYYTLNMHGVLCAESTLPDGKTWYTFCDSTVPENEIKRDIINWLKSYSKRFEYSYKVYA